MVYKHLPKGARNIEYIVKPYGGVLVADFTITEKEFEIWGAVKGWEIRGIDTPRHIRQLSKDSENASVERGYEIYRDRNEKGRLSGNLEVIYDIEESRCYYRYYVP